MIYNKTIVLNPTKDADMWAALLQKIEDVGYELTWLDGPNNPFPALHIHRLQEVRQCSELHYYKKWTNRYADYRVINIAEFLGIDYKPPPPPTIEEVFKF